MKKSELIKTYEELKTHTTIKDRMLYSLDVICNDLNYILNDLLLEHEKGDEEILIYVGDLIAQLKMVKKEIERKKG